MAQKKCLYPVLILITAAMVYIFHGKLPHRNTKVIQKNLNATQTHQRSHLPFPSVDTRLRRWLGKNVLSWKSSFYAAMKQKVDANNRLFLGIVDASYTDMAYNMYLTSFKRFNITNFLYVCGDRKAVDSLKSKGVYCYHYEQHLRNAAVPAEAGHGSFVVKTAPKMKIILLALLYGFDTILIDIDIVFLKDPMPYLSYENVDIVLQQDIPGYGLNVGFGIVYATNASRSLFTQVGRMRINNKVDDQSAVNRVLKQMRNKSLVHSAIFDVKKFPVGEFYYLEGKREFLGDNPCSECVIVHSSGIRSKVAKIYRFKEGLLWAAEEKEYYASPNRKYLMYENTRGFTGKDVVTLEDKALKTAFAIGFILNRTVILPKLHCEKNLKCNLLHRYRIEALEDFLKGRYREHVFLENPLVPKNVKEGLSPLISLVHSESESESTEKVKVFKSNHLDDGYMVASAIKGLFDKSPWTDYPVLRFQSLYFDVKGLDPGTTRRIQKGICKSGYIQIKTCPRH